MMYLGKNAVAIAKDTGGVKPITGIATAPSTNTNMVISFGKTLTKYMYLIEATNDAKASIIASGQAADKAYLWYGIYPVNGINNVSTNDYTTCLRFKPLENTISISETTAIFKTDTDIKIPTRDITSSNPNYSYYGLSYKYTIFPLD